MEPQNNDSKIGLLAIIVFLFLMPILVAAWISSIGVLLMAWHFMVSCL